MNGEVYEVLLLFGVQFLMRSNLQRNSSLNMSEKHSFDIIGHALLILCSRKDWFNGNPTSNSWNKMF